MPTATRAIALALADIKLAHSVFALPFAILGAVLAAPASPDSAETTADAVPLAGLDAPPAWGPFAGMLALVVACMVCARTWAMLVNRLADAAIDAGNPRTARRAVASGALPIKQGWAIAMGAAFLFIACCAAFFVAFVNPWPLLLSGPVLVWIGFYSYTKRFTALCHLFLGGALAASPICAALAVGPAHVFALSPAGETVLLLAGFVALWVAGFDVAYALQDLDYDRRVGLRSVPAALGVRGALWTSRGLHLAAAGLLVATVGVDPRLGLVYSLGVGAVLALLVVEHAVLTRRGVAGLPIAFFTINGIVSLVLGAAGVIDVFAV